MIRSFFFVILLSLGVISFEDRVDKRLQWNTFVVCPGGEIAIGQRCTESVEKKNFARRFRTLERYLDMYIFILIYLMVAVFFIRKRLPFMEEYDFEDDEEFLFGDDGDDETEPRPDYARRLFETISRYRQTH